MYNTLGGMTHQATNKENSSNREQRAERAVNRASAAASEKRVKRALSLLSEGMGRASVSRRLAAEHNLSIRQAQRYTQTAALELMGEPLSTLQLDTDIALDLRKLDLLADSALEKGDEKLAIQAIKAHAGIANTRLRSLEAVAERSRGWFA